MRKQLLVVMILAMALAVTGCSPYGVEFSQLIKEVNSVEDSYDTGVVSVKLEVKDEYMQDPQIAQLVELINSSEISYVGVKGEDKYSVGIDLVTNGETIRITHIVMDEGTMYMQVDTLEAIEEYFITGVYTESTDPVYVKSTGEISLAFSEGVELFIESLIDVYQDFVYDGLLEKEGNKFIMSVASEDLDNLIYELEKYTLENKEEIIDNFDIMIDNISEEEFSKNFPGDTRESLKLEIRESIEGYEMSEFTGTEDMPDMEFTMGLEKIEGSSVTYASEYKFKIESDEFDIELIAVNNSRVLDETSEDMFTLEPNATVIENIPDVEIVEPMPGQRNKMIIDSVTNEYFVDIANDALPGRVEQVNIITQEGRIYLPLRQVGESLGEDVQWDAQSMTPYINQNGERIDMGGLLIDSKAYVKIRDFEKVGYTVEWDDVTKEATLIK